MVTNSILVQVLDLESPSSNTVLQPSDGSSHRWYSPGTEEPTKAVALPPQVKAFPATPEFIAKAREAVRKMSAGGGESYYYNNILNSNKLRGISVEVSSRFFTYPLYDVNFN